MNFTTLRVVIYSSWCRAHSVKIWLQYEFYKWWKNMNKFFPGVSNTFYPHCMRILFQKTILFTTLTIYFEQLERSKVSHDVSSSTGGGCCRTMKLSSSTLLLFAAAASRFSSLRRFNDVWRSWRRFSMDATWPPDEPAEEPAGVGSEIEFFIRWLAMRKEAMVNLLKFC